MKKRLTERKIANELEREAFKIAARVLDCYGIEYTAPTGMVKCFTIFPVQSVNYYLSLRVNTDETEAELVAGYGTSHRRWKRNKIACFHLGNPDLLKLIEKRILETLGKETAKWIKAAKKEIKEMEERIKKMKEMGKILGDNA